MSHPAAAALVLGCALAMPATASAQVGPPGGDVFLDLRKVPVGSYGEYTLAVGGQTVWMRNALVARTQQTQTLEISTQAAVGAASSRRMVQRMVMAADPDAREWLKSMVVQLGDDADPMDVTPAMPRDNKKAEKKPQNDLVGSETIHVAAGTFKVKHFRTKGRGGGTIDTWTSEAVPPTGIVKMTAFYPPGTAPPPYGGADEPVTFVLQLMALGKDAKTAITRPVQPFDPRKLSGMLPGTAGP